MNNPATPQDVTGSFERSLTSDEQRVLPNWLDKAWRELQRVVPGIPARVALPETTLGHLDVDDVIDVVVAMVERKLRNPDGLRSWKGDDYDQTIDVALSSGQIYVSDTERESLMPTAPTFGTGIYSIPLTSR